MGRLRRAADTGWYEVTIRHAIEELAADGFTLDDAETDDD